MDWDTAQSNLEAGLSRIKAELSSGRERVAELEILEQRQIGAMQFAAAQKAADAQPPADSAVEGEQEE